ncbi:hypothetical protein BDN72DRAFT_906595 [Pluteus cervinus]|uniref:Uncharacterized protein n=1 Tax=Pluteus cervinus TaxID=181527 RepID=A0ACD3A135_9AGAR|nr:hypothetical protein BDN72DRAFT_906595 [Pluteus cervinus]
MSGRLTTLSNRKLHTRQTYTIDAKPRIGKKRPGGEHIQQGDAKRYRQLQERLSHLENPLVGGDDRTPLDISMVDPEDVSSGEFADLHELTEQVPSQSNLQKKPTYKPTPPVLTAKDISNRQFDNWMKILPDLIEPLVEYVASSLGKVSPGMGDSDFICTKDGCKQTKHVVLCAYLTHFNTINILLCACHSVAQVLISRGLFPAFRVRTK